MLFLTLEDRDDMFEAVMFPDITRRFAELLLRYKYLKITGTVNTEGGNTAIVADHVEPAPTGLAEKPYI